MDSGAFQPCTYNVSQLTHTHLEKLLRSALFESYLSGEYLSMMLDLIPIIKNEFLSLVNDNVASNQEAELDKFPTLDLLHKLIGLATQCAEGTVTSYALM